MKKIAFLFAIIIGTLLNPSFAQLGSIDKLAKQGATSVGDAKQSGTTTLLSNLDQKLKSQFKLDGVKSQIVGSDIRTRIADANFSKLTDAARVKQGNQMLDAAKGNLASGGTDLKSLGLKNLILDVGKSMSPNEILQSFKKPL